MILGIDFDGTVCDHQFPEIGRPVPLAIVTLQELVVQGHKLILWTMRSGYSLDAAVDWFETNDIPLWGIQRNPEQDSWTCSPKAYCEMFIDDAGFGAPLIQPIGFSRPCLDWSFVRTHFNLRKVI